MKTISKIFVIFELKSKIKLILFMADLFSELCLIIAEYFKDQKKKFSFYKLIKENNTDLCGCRL